MPVQRFFAMREAAKRLESQDRMELVAIAATPAYPKEYAESLQDSYRRLATKEVMEPDYVAPDDAKDLLKAMFGK